MPKHAITDPGHGVKSDESEGVENLPLGILTKQSDAPPSEYRKASGYPLKFKLQRQAQKALPEKRVSVCHRHVREHHFGEVVGKSQNGRAQFINVLRCGSVWDCPVCADKIASERSQMVLRGMNEAIDGGFAVDLLTITVPHAVHQPCKQVIASLTACRGHFRDSRAFKSWAKSAGLLGVIWATEVTYGRNGWHPHCHALVFSQNRGLEALRAQWTDSVVKQGLLAPNRHGFRVSVDRADKSGAAEYVSKWGLENELTRGDLKKSRFSGVTPFQILHAMADSASEAFSKLRSHYSGDLGELFREYSEAFHGRPQLLWTNGLKKALGVEDVSDAELAERSEIDESKPHEIWSLDQVSWMVVLAHDARGELLYYAAKYGQAGVDALVTSLKGYEDIDEPWYMCHEAPFHASA
jgi:hypothetical protein